MSNKSSKNKQDKKQIQLDKHDSTVNNDTASADINEILADSSDTEAEVSDTTVSENQLPLTADSDDINFADNPETTTNVTVEEKPSKTSAFVAIILGILIIVGGWGLYTYFTDQSNEEGQINDAAQVSADENQNSETQETDYEGITVPNQGDEITDDSSETSGQSNMPGLGETAEVTDSSTTTVSANVADDSSETTVTTTSQEQAWKANNYSHGDITGDSYTVVSGDTLWEISEAVYGSGSQWHKIADANNVSYLSNGNPLIIPGQVLTLP